MPSNSVTKNKVDTSSLPNTKIENDRNLNIRISSESEVKVDNQCEHIHFKHGPTKKCGRLGCDTRQPSCIYHTTPYSSMKGNDKRIGSHVKLI